MYEGEREKERETLRRRQHQRFFGFAGSDLFREEKKAHFRGAKVTDPSVLGM
jgi:hypothetical protein